MKIGQISFIQMTSPVDTPYGHGALASKYQGDTEPDAEPLPPGAFGLARARPRAGSGDRPRADRWRTATIPVTVPVSPAEMQ